MVTKGNAKVGCKNLKNDPHSRQSTDTKLPVLKGTQQSEEDHPRGVQTLELESVRREMITVITSIHSSSPIFDWRTFVVRKIVERLTVGGSRLRENVRGLRAHG